MRIDIVQSSPIPDVQKVAQNKKNVNQVNNDDNSRNSKRFANNNSGTMQVVKKDNVKDKVNDAVKKMIDASLNSDTSLKFKVNEQTQRVIIQVLDKKGNVINEIPPEKMLEMMSSICKLVGVNVDEKA